MEPKSASSSKNLTRYIALGGIGLAIFGASYYIWSKVIKRNRSGAKRKHLPKDLVIKILTITKRELFPMWNTLAGECRGFLMDSKLRNLPEEFKTDVLARGEKHIVDITGQVLAELKVNLNDYDYSLYEVYKNDKEVKLKLDAIYNELYGVLEGYLDTTAAIPEFLTPQRALEIAVKALKEHARRLNEVWQMSTQHCDWEYFNTLVGGVELVAAKVEVMKGEGLGGFEDHPDKILGYAIASFSSEDDGFRMKIEELTCQTAVLLPKIYNQAPDLEKALEEYGNGIIDAQEVTLPAASADKI